MTTLDETINLYISGTRGEWYYQFCLCGVEFGGGYFRYRKDARDHLKAKLRKLIRNDDILLYVVIACLPGA